MNNPARPSSSDARRALKIASQVAVNMLGGGKDAARLTVVDPSMLSLYSALHEEDRFMRLDVALDLDLAVGEPVLARALAAAQGFALVRESADVRAEKIDLDDYASLHREAFEAKSSVLAAVQQKSMTPAQRKSALKELADLRQVISIIESKIEGA